MGRTAGAQILLFMREAECQWYYETRTPKKPNPVKCVGGIPKHENANVQIRKRTRAEPEGTKDSTVTDLPSESEEAEPPESWCISDEAEAEVTTESESAAQANSARVVNKPVSDSFAGKIGKERWARIHKNGDHDQLRVDTAQDSMEDWFAQRGGGDSIWQ